MKNKRAFIGFLVGILSSLIFVVMGPENVFAGKTANVYNYINNKAYYQGIYNCYTHKYSQKKNGHYYDVKGSVQLDEVKNTQSFVYDIAYYYQPFAKKETNGCKTVFKNFSKKPNTTSAESIKNYVEGMGYSVDASDGKTCYGLSFTKNKKKKTYNSNMICPDGNGFKSVGSSNSGVRLYVDSEEKAKLGGKSKSAAPGDPRKICLTVGIITEKSNACRSVKEGKNLSKGLVEGLVKDLCGVKCVGSSDKSQTVQNFKATKQKMEGSTAKVGGRKSAASKAIGYLSGDKYKSIGAAKISEIEKRLLYQSYLNYYGVDISCSKGAKATSDGSIKWYTNGKIKTCYYSTTNAKNKNVKLNGVSGGFLKKGSIAGLDDALAKTKGLKSSYSEDELALAKKIVGGEFNEEEGSKKESAKEDNCLGAGSASGLNWIVCSVLDWITGAVEKIYNAVEGFLAIPVSLFADNPNTREAWETFRNVANILFVILFLLVIFSQLTGVGIDNYGIKRILPKLIVIAILINLSYIICELVIDVSNLLGNGFLGLFRSFADSFNGATATVEDGTVGLDDALVGVSALGIVAGFGMVLANPAMLLTLFVSAIGVLMSVLFLFVLLSIREAAVLVLTVVSPIAVVLYAMPNTKSIFDKWLKFFEGLLLVYPIAGLLIGAGDYVARLLVSTGAADGMGIFAAIIVSVAPVFLIPTVLKHSFAAMGSIGSKLTGFGQTLSGGTTKRMRDSDTYKNIQEMGAEHATMRRAGVKMGKDGQYHLKTGVLANVMAGGSRLRARNLSRFLGDQKKLDEANGLLSDNGVGFEAASIAQRKGAEADMVANYVTKINDDTRNGENEGELFKLYDDYVRDGNKYGAAAVARIAGRRKDTAERFSKRVEGSSLTYNPEMMKAVSKEMATGENSSMYRQSSPMGFEFASQVNSGKARSQNYSEWLGQKQVDENGKVIPDSQTNASLALEHHVTNSQELVGMKGKELEELYGLMQNGTVDAETSARISNLATQAIENRDKPGSTWDSTKADQLAHISGKYDYDSSKDILTKRAQTT